jgi:hypothetical protein
MACEHGGLVATVQITLKVQIAHNSAACIDQAYNQIEAALLTVPNCKTMVCDITVNAEDPA